MCLTPPIYDPTHTYLRYKKAYLCAVADLSGSWQLQIPSLGTAAAATANDEEIRLGVQQVATSATMTARVD